MGDTDGKRMNRLVSITSEATVRNVAKEDTSWGVPKSNTAVRSGPGIINIGHTDCCCSCYKEQPLVALLDSKKPPVDSKMIQKLLEQKELELKLQFQQTLEKETKSLKERFDFILQNEQVRSSLKLREAHRERKEKIKILMQQLESKNIAGLMYVMCSERAKSKFEKLQIIEKYTNYIEGLNEILIEGQQLILNLSRGYKTAARVDYEWQNKMKKVVSAFQNFIFHFAGGSPEQNQYFFDVPSLLHTDAPKEDDPNENPIEEEHEPEIMDPADFPENKSWWERLDDDDRPFVVYGDMAHMKPPVRRETLKRVKAPKTAPKKWMEYAFHDMFLHSNCPNADDYKEVYLDNLYDPGDFQCEGLVPETESKPSKKRLASLSEPVELADDRRSVDMRTNNMMGSILKIMNASQMIQGLSQTASSKANLLGARDSMEIVSSTKMRESIKPAITPTTPTVKKKSESEVIQVGSRRTSLYFDDEVKKEDLDIIATSMPKMSEDKGILKRPSIKDEEAIRKIEAQYQPSNFCKNVDSLTNVVVKKPEVIDRKINYEKVCPMEKCQRTSLVDFMKSLPAYMREHTFTHREQTFDQYEPCTPEQLEILRRRLEEAKKRDKRRPSCVEPGDPLLEWKPSIEGVGCQTSITSYMDLPPCTCKESSIISGVGAVYKMEDLIPMKQHLDKVQKDCFFDDQIEFNRFKVIGLDSSDSVRTKNRINNFKSDFTSSRLQEIRKILKQHPSLCEIFQANTRC